MKKKLITFLLIVDILAAAFAYDYFIGSRPAGEPAPAANSETDTPKAPDFEFSVFTRGATQRLYDYQGKTVLLNFWASWCKPCLEEFPALTAFAARNPNNVVVIALSVDDAEEDINKFVRTMTAKGVNISGTPNLLIVHDKNKAISQDIFQTVKYPETIIIAPDMTMRRKIAGVISESDFSEIESSFEAIIRP